MDIQIDVNALLVQTVVLLGPNENKNQWNLTENIQFWLSLYFVLFLKSLRLIAAEKCLNKYRSRTTHKKKLATRSSISDSNIQLDTFVLIQFKVKCYCCCSRCCRYILNVYYFRMLNLINRHCSLLCYSSSLFAISKSILFPTIH